MGSRTWIKIYCDKWLNGTLREETPETRGVWVDLLALAGSSKYGDDGVIKMTDHVGFLDSQVAEFLQISTQKWTTIKNKLIATSRISVENSNIIRITNWSKYQSEYNRQHVYRDPQKSVTKSYNGDCNETPEKSTPREGRGERGEERLENTPLNPPITQKEKKRYGEFNNVLLSEKELQKLKDKFGMQAEVLIEKLSSYMESKGKHYKSHYATILNWQRKDDGKAKNTRDLPKTYTPTPNYSDV